jgi:hypothetical protein
MPQATAVTLSNQIDSPQSSDGYMTGQSALAPIGFYGQTPAVQPTAATNVHAVAAGSTTTVFVNTTFDGSIGSTAYTLGDLVAALKTLGLIKS